MAVWRLELVTNLQPAVIKTAEFGKKKVRQAEAGENGQCEFEFQLVKHQGFQVVNERWRPRSNISR